MTSLPTLRALILAAAAVASPLLALSLPAAAAGQGARVPGGMKTPFVKISRSALVRDHRKNPRCPWTGRWHCDWKRPQ